MQNFANLVLWIYIVLLVVGRVDWLSSRRKSRVSLIMSVTFAALLRPLRGASCFSILRCGHSARGAAGGIRHPPDQDEEIHAFGNDVDPNPRGARVTPPSLAIWRPKKSLLPCLKPPCPFGENPFARLSIRCGRANRLILSAPTGLRQNHTGSANAAAKAGCSAMDRS